MELDNFIPEWADRHGYYHHSNPILPDFYTFYEKGIKRPKLKHFWDILANRKEGDKELARAMVKILDIENPKMRAGSIVQEYVEGCLIGGFSEKESLRNAIARYDEYEIKEWREEEAVFESRKTPRFNETGKIAKAGEFSEIELVAQNALLGVKEAINELQLNEIVGEKEYYGKIEGCELDYLGKPDFSSRIELKTQWDSKTETDSPRANSIPKNIKQIHLTQIAGYYGITNLSPAIVYANRLGFKMFIPEKINLENAWEKIKRDCQRRERLMKLAKTPEELLKICDPQLDHPFVYKDLHPKIFREIVDLS
tara:strand:- start:5109 stop:6041 length:933 start_codon:yes stop_codon:yes gene_type:complete